MTGAMVAGMPAAVFASMLERPLKRRVSLASGIDPGNRVELLAALSELQRVGEEWKRQRRISVAAGSVTEMHPGSSLDMEISAKQAAELLDRTASRIRQLLRSGELPARKVGRRWLLKRHDVIAYCANSRKAAA